MILNTMHSAWMRNCTQSLLDCNIYSLTLHFPNLFESIRNIAMELPSLAVLAIFFPVFFFTFFFLITIKSTSCEHIIIFVDKFFIPEKNFSDHYILHAASDD